MKYCELRKATHVLYLFHKRMCFIDPGHRVVLMVIDVAQSQLK